MKEIEYLIKFTLNENSGYSLKAIEKDILKRLDDLNQDLLDENLVNGTHRINMIELGDYKK